MTDVGPVPPLGHKSSNSIGLNFNDSDNAPTTVDLSEDLPPRLSGSPFDTSSGLAPRTHSPRVDSTSTFASSTLVSNQTQHRGHLPRIQTERGLIPGTPPTPTSEPMTPHSIDSRKNSSAYSDSPYTDGFPLSGPNDRRTFGANDEAAKPTGFIGSTPYWLGMYFFFNLGLTLFNKVVLVSFPFAYVSFGFALSEHC